MRRRDQKNRTCIGPHLRQPRSAESRMISVAKIGYVGRSELTNGANVCHRHGPVCDSVRRAFSGIGAMIRAAQSGMKTTERAVAINRQTRWYEYGRFQPSRKPLHKISDIPASRFERSYRRLPELGRSLRAQSCCPVRRSPTSLRGHKTGQLVCYLIRTTRQLTTLSHKQSCFEFMKEIYVCW
jgi:hypothetical protein